ncbi:MAG TPA: hypothetical protein VFG35_18760 [Actinoplanes sp.]|nr:hypothetical protein [Actinoplanes sp.]
MTSKQLDRRREQSAAAKNAAERTRTTVTELDNRLRTNAELTQQQTQALRNAEAEIKRLRRSLKTQARDKERLDKAHRKAVSQAAKAQAKSSAIEAKYGKILLAEMVDREKERDRAVLQKSSSTPAAAPVSPALPAVVPPVPDKTATAAPAASTTAQATAARTTARKAASSASTTRTRAPRKTTTVVETPAPTPATRRRAPRKATT